LHRNYIKETVMLDRRYRTSTARKSWLAALLAGALLPGAAVAEEARLVADLATGDVARGSGTGPLVSLGAENGHRFLFAADDDRHGRELWISDGTDAGTRLVLDLCPGSCSSDPSRITRVGAQTFFFADDGGFPHALFVSDGTAAGTRRVHELADAISGFGHSMAVGNFFVFEMYTAADGGELYRSDGTRGGTRRLAEGCPGNCSRHVFEPVSTSQGLFWYDRNIDEVFHLDLAAENIRVLDAICTDSPCAPQIGELDGKILVTTHNDDASRLVRLVGLDGDTEVLRSFANPSPFNHFNFGPFARSGAKLYFSGSYQGDRRLYETDGTVAGSIPTPLAPFEGVFFQIFAVGGIDLPVLPLYSSELRKFHVFKAGVGSVEVLGNGSPPQWIGFSPATGAIFFRAPDQRLFWVLPDLSVRYASGTLSDVDAFSVIDLGGGEVALRVDRDGGLEPWRLRVADEAWSKIRDVAQDGEASSRPEPFAVAQGFLAVLDAQRDPDVAPPSTNLLKLDDAATQAMPWADRNFEAFAHGAGGLFLREVATPFGLHFSDGQTTAAATGAVQPSAEPGRHAATAERLYFTTELEGQDLWTSDGTPAGTRLIQDPRPGWTPGCLFLCEPGEPIPVQVPIGILADEDHVYWSGHDEEFVYELWRVDPAGATPIALLEESSYEPLPLIAWRGKLYFQLWVRDSADPYQGVWQLWVNENGASRSLADLTPRHLQIYSPRPAGLAAGLGDAVVFVIDEQDGRLWRSDGTTQGTRVVRELGEGVVVRELAATSSHVYLALATPEQGAEPWISDGTTAGTGPLGDLYPGPRGSHPAGLHPLADGRVLFAADDGIHGHEAWITDGTPDGTRLLFDLGAGASGPGHWASKSGRVLFAANAGTLGRELYAMELDLTLPPCPSSRLCLQDGRFEVEVAFSAPDGASDAGQRALTSESSGVFTFFSPANWELTVKVLDGCAINDRFWVFAAATTDVEYELRVLDRASGQRRTYRNEAGTLAAAVTDTGAFATCAATPPAPRFGPAAEAPPAARICPDDEAALCLGEDGRFRASVEWETADGADGAGLPVPYGSADSGLFTFFSADNWELMVKVLDGCALNQHHWLFAAGTTNVGWTLTLEDRLGQLPSKIYTNPVGTASAAIADTSAMACTP
jgi:ELWxxDGT repeat protein